MTTSFSKDLTRTSIREKVRKFYDLGSPLYFEVYDRHIHDGYYITGRETKQEAQENLTRLLIEKARIRRDGPGYFYYALKIGRAGTRGYPPH
jgi:hypothetical protein